MAAKRFQFKQFSVGDDRCAHKIGTDAVVLGAWVTLGPGDQRVLDIGAGSGVIALMVAQRTSSKTIVDAVELAEADAAQAAENAQLSPWQDRIYVHHKALQEYNPDVRYDVAVSNPPFFINSLLSPEEERRRARHGGQLDFAQLLQHSCRLLKPEGRLALILPVAEAELFNALAIRDGLRCIRRTFLHTRPGRPPERVLMEWASSGLPVPDTDLLIADEKGNWTPGYRRLTKPFYLKA